MRSSSRNRELLGLSETLILQISAAAVLFGFHLVSARLLPIESYGALNFGLSLAGLLTLACALGYPNLLLRVVASAVQSQSWGILKGVLLQATRNVVLLSAIAMLGLLACSWWLPGLTPDQVAGLRIAAVAIALYPVGFLRAKTALGLGSVRCSIVPEEILRPVAFMALLAVLVIVAGVEPDGSDVAALLVGSLVMAMVGGIWCLRLHMPVNWFRAAAERKPAEWRRSSRRMMFGGVFQEVITRSDVIALGLLATMSASALFSACSKLALLNVFLLKVVDTFYAPKMAAAFNAGDRDGLWALIRRTGLLSLAGSLPVAVLLIAFPAPLLGLFGPEFREAVLPLQILAAGTLVNAATGSVGYALLMSNNERYFAGIAGLVALANVTAHAVFTPTFGIVGAAIITALSVAIQNLLMLGTAYRLLKHHG